MERDGPLELNEATGNGKDWKDGKQRETEKEKKKLRYKQRETEKGKKRKTYFTYWNTHDLENWDLQSQPTITADEMEELEELEQLIVLDKKIELDKKDRI